MDLKFRYGCRIDDYGRKVSYIEAVDSECLGYVYRDLHLNYPKFFKMDDLSKVGFLAVERLMIEYANLLDVKTTGVVFFSKEASLPTDRHFEETICDTENFFPSPSIFVYTLPNIVCGEVCIRHGFQGETSFYVLENYDVDVVKNICCDMLANNSAVICGVVDFPDGGFSAQAEVFTAVSLKI